MALRALFATNVRVVEFACVTGTRVSIRFLFLEMMIFCPHVITSYRNAVASCGKAREVSAL